jgi:Uma2 family endonuclease
MSVHVGRTDLTVEDFWALPEEDGVRLELARGQVVREPAPGLPHAWVARHALDLLRRAGEERGLGFVFFDLGCRVATNPDTVRVPDLAFVAAGRFERDGIPRGFLDGAPDLAIEILSPSNTASEMQRKALEYLDAGARLVWIVDPDTATVILYRSRAEVRILGEDEPLDAGEVIPGLESPVSALFRRPPG